jgi:signal transduction histidine kinase/ligand-binding sensor domain-containing protein/AraC-like DNA-binding protein
MRIIKRSFNRKFYFLSFILLHYVLSFAISQDFTFKRIENTDGLSENSVLCIHQDKKGFLWFGTLNGLSRYDGQNFHVISSKIGEKYSLYNGRIQSIKEDNSGNLWMVSFGGMIQKYDMIHEEISYYPQKLGFETKSYDSQINITDDNLVILTFQNLGIFIIDNTNGKETIQSFLFPDYLSSDEDLLGINFVLPVNQNKIFLGTTNGLFKLNPNNTNQEEPKFTRVLSKNSENTNITEYCETDSSFYFISSRNGFYQINKEDEQIYHFTSLSEIDCSQITHIKRSGEGVIWMSTSNNGIIGIRRQNEIIHISASDNKKIDNTSELFLDNSGFIWFRDAKYDGFFKINPLNFNISYYKTDINNSIDKSISRNNEIVYFFQDSNRNIWIGTRSSGLYYYNYKTDKLKCFLNDPVNINSIGSNGHLSIYEDPSGALWLGTRRGGVNMVNLKQKEFSQLIPNKFPETRFYNEVGSLLIDKEGLLWFGTYEGKFYSYNFSNEKLITFSNDESFCKNNGFKNFWSYSVMQDSWGYIWQGTKGNGLFKLTPPYPTDPKSVRFNQFALKPSPSQNFQHVYDIIEDRNKQIWVATYGEGLILIQNPHTNSEIVNYTDYLNSIQKTKPIIMGRCVLEDSKGRIWYGGLNGLCRFKLEKDQISPTDYKFYSYNTSDKNFISHNDVVTIYEDKSEHIWIGTNGGGLNKYNEESKSFEFYTKDDGLPSNIIFGIIEDHWGHLWISTDNGLSKFNERNNVFLNYFKNDGLPTNTFYEAKPVRSETGELFFGTTNGIVHFYPNNLLQSEYEPDILFTNFQISNVDQLTLENETSYKKNINYLKNIKLVYFQNNFSIEYASTSFVNSKNTVYAIMLENYDAEFHHVGNEKKATYTNLSPGKYIFKVKSVNNDGIWSNKSSSIGITISPPFWKTTWAYLFYAIIMSVLIIISIKIIRRINRLNTSLMLEKKITNIKLKFFTNISHEFRTPLTMIINPISEILKEFKTISKTKEEELLILTQKNARRLLHLVTDILDFRKIQSKNAKLKVSRNNLDNYFNKIIENFYYNAKNREIDFNYTCRFDQATAWFDIEKLEKIITNLIINALKFTPPEGKVNVVCTMKSNRIIFSVEDTGIGFEMKDGESLFDRHYQQNEDIYTGIQGSGIGLSLVKELTKLHKGTISFESKKNEGSRFEVSIPCSHNDYSDEEIMPERNWVTGTNAILLNEEMKKTPISDLLPIPPKNNEKILLVEDDVDLRDYLKNKLSTLYIIETAIHGADGFKMAKQFMPDLIITDIMMPVMDGMQFINKIRNSFETSHIPVIILTAKTALDDRKEGYTKGANAFIEKPFEIELLLARINGLLDQHKLLHEKFIKSTPINSTELYENDKDKIFIQNIEKYVLERIDKSDLLIEDVYTAMGFGKTIFYNKIKKLTGCSPNEFIKIMRLKKAAEYLAQQNDLNISEICFSIGYTDINYFRKQFKSYFKMTPREYRNLMQDSNNENTHS